MSFLTKTKEAFGWIDGNLIEAQGGEPAVTIASLLISSSAAEWSTFETNYGTTGSLLKALNDAWDHGGGVGAINVEVITEATYEILYTDVGTFFTFVNPVAGESVYVTLPRAVDSGEGALIDILVAGPMIDPGVATGTFVISPPEGDSFIWTNGDHSADLLGTTQDYSKITLISDGVNTWGVYNAYGWWGDCYNLEGSWLFTSKFMFSSYLPGSTEDNVVTIDAFGNIKDSGTAIGDLGGGSPNLSSVIMPTSGSPTSMDRGDEWFNVSYSTSVIQGFNILNVIPDDRMEPTPLTYLVTIDDGECSLRASSSPNSQIIVFSIAGDAIYVTGPVCYVYVDSSGEVPVINTKSSWTAADSKANALLYVFTIYEANAPVSYVLESILVETETNPVLQGSSTQCTAWGTYTNWVDPVDITASVIWTSDYAETNHVSIDETGLAYGELSGGSSLITASLGIVEGTLSITCNPVP